MGFVISDGKGKNGDAEVNAEQELVVRAITEEEIEHASSQGKAYSWDSTTLNIDAGDTMLFVKNIGDTPLVLDRVTVNGSNVICIWEFLLGALTTTPAGGSEVLGKNLNPRFATTPADSVSRSDETAVADGDIVDRVTTAISLSMQHDLHGIILEKNEYIQINQITASTSGSVVLIGHFANPS